MIFPLAGPAIVAAAGRKASLMEAPDGILVLRLKGEMNVGGSALVCAQRIDPQFIALEMTFVIAANRLVESTEHGPIKAFACGKIPRAQMNVIDEPPDV